MYYVYFTCLAINLSTFVCNDMSSISAVIITFNEERNIERCIRSLEGIADEVIVVDSFSRDDTPDICRELGAELVQVEWRGYKRTKNFANKLAKCDYILSIDADEALSVGLQKNIKAIKQSGLTSVYSFNRITNYCGTWIKYCGWYPDVKIRLFPKEGSRWEGEFVHEELTVPQQLPVVHLQGNLEHFSYYNTTEHRERADKYSVLTAEKLYHQGKTCSFLKPYLSAIGKMFGVYLIKKGFLDGKAGWQIARISAASNVVKYKELRRLMKERK